MHSILLSEPSAGGALLSTFIPMILLFVFMYFIMIRPQQKEEKKKALMLSELAVGDTVLTTSGFYGTIIDISDDILYRTVNADGSKKTGVPNVKGVTYEWAKNTTIVNKKTVLNSVVDVVKQQLYAELNKTEDEITKGMIKFFSDDLNLVLFDSDSIGKLASDYLSLCSVPALVAKLEKEKNDIWFENYQEKIKGAKFDNTFKVSNVKKSDVEGFKYIVECSTFYTTFLKEDFNSLVESSKAGYELANMEMGIRELRKSTFDNFKGTYQKLMYIKFYTNDDKVLDLNNKSEFHVSGILHKVDFDGVVKQIHVYEN